MMRSVRRKFCLAAMEMDLEMKMIMTPVQSVRCRRECCCWSISNS